MKTSRTPKAKNSLASMRRRFLKDQKPVTSADRLTADEIGQLHDLVEIASKSTHRVIEAGSEVTTRRELLNLAEAELIAARKENTEIHTKIAPLLHRLPA